MSLILFKADLLSNDPKHAEQFREALTNLDEYLEEMYKTTDSDNNGHVNMQEFDNMRDELWNGIYRGRHKYWYGTSNDCG